MKKTIIYILITFAMLFSLAVGLSISAAADLAAHVHGADGCVHDEGDITWTAWEQTNSLPAEAGNYYLTNDVNISSTWSPQNGTKLCLNGHVIKNSSGCVINIPNERQFTLTDCNSEAVHYFSYNKADRWSYISSPTQTQINAADTVENIDTSTSVVKVFGGCITGGWEASITSGGGIRINANSVLTMYAGNIVGNGNYYKGGGVGLWGSNSKAFFYGGSVIGNVTSSYDVGGAFSTTCRGGGIDLSFEGSSAEFGGDFRISHNTSGEKSSVRKVDNLRVAGGRTITVMDGFSGSIGVSVLTTPTAGNPVAITGGKSIACSMDCFVSDQGYDFVRSGSKTDFVLKAVSADENTYRACIGDEKFFALQDAVNFAENEQTISMRNDTVEQITIESNQDITLDLNGYVIKGISSGAYRPVIINNGKLTIVDGNADAEHFFTYNKKGKWTLIDEPAQEQKTAADTVEAIDSETAVVKVFGGCITGGYNSGNAGAGIRGGTTSSTLIMNGGSIVGNEGHYNVGGVFSFGSCILNSGQIIGNYASNTGAVAGGVSSQKISIGGSFRISNNVNNLGEASNIYLKNGNTLTIQSGFAGAAGVSTEKLPTAGNPVAITSNGSEADLNYITSDNLAYRVIYVPAVSEPEAVAAHLELARYDIDAFGTSPAQITLADNSMSEAQAKAILKDDAGHTDGIVVYAVSSGNYSYLTYADEPGWSKSNDTKTFEALKSYSGKVYVIGNVRENQAISAPTLKSKTLGSITLNTAAAGHGATKYGCSLTNNPDNASWSSSETFSGLSPDTKYYFFTKYEGDKDYIAVVSEAKEITINKVTLSVTANDSYFSGKAYDENTISVSAVDKGGATVNGLSYTYTWYKANDMTKSLTSVPSAVGAYKLVVALAPSGLDYLAESKTISVKILPAPVDDSHDPASGESSFIIGSDEPVVFISMSDVNDFVSLSVSKNGRAARTLTKGVHYTVESGSTKITLTDSYRDSLTSGSYTFSINSKLPNTVSELVKTDFKLDVSRKIVVSGIYNINVDSDIKNGAVVSDTNSAKSGTTVTLTVKEDEGWCLETIEVFDKSGKEIELITKETGKTYTFRMPASDVTVKASFMEDNSMLNYFIDVKPGDYFCKAVIWAAESGITSGTDSFHFSPDLSCTRAQMVTFLWRAAGSPEPEISTCSFVDVDESAYYYKAVLWAVNKGIVHGTGDTTFSPDDECTRAHVVTFLYRYAGSPAVAAENIFADVSSSEYYCNAVLWAVENGITEGTGAASFSPDANCTRAQIVTFLYRYLVK